MRLLLGLTIVCTLTACSDATDPNTLVPDDVVGDWLVSEINGDPVPGEATLYGSPNQGDPVTMDFPAFILLTFETDACLVTVWDQAGDHGTWEIDGATVRIDFVSGITLEFVVTGTTGTMTDDNGNLLKFQRQ